MCRGCLRGVCTLVLWAVWLALAVLLFMQLRLATADEIAIPEAVLRNVETRLGERGLRFAFGAIHCDTKGHIVVRDLKVFSQTHDDPVVAVKAVRFEVNPYALWTHRVLPRAARIEGASFRMPAMLSSDGTNAAVIDDINAEIEFAGSRLLINGLSARTGNLAVTCRGAVVLPEGRGAAKPPSDLFSDVVTAYLKIARHFERLVPQLDVLDAPVLDITLTPDEKRIAIAAIRVAAGSLHFDVAGADSAKDGKADALITLGPFSARTSVDLESLFSPEHARPLRIQASATDVAVSHVGHVRDAAVTLTVPLEQAMQLGRGPSSAIAEMPPLDLSLACELGSVSARDMRADALTARVTGRFPDDVRAGVTAVVLGEPVALETDADLVAKKATAHVVTNLSQSHVEAVSRAVRYDVGAIIKPARPIGLDAVARLDAGWRFASASGELDIGPIYADEVNVDRARGSFVYDHAAGTLRFSPALAVVGESFAHGSYEMNFKTLDYRFLLQGELRPPAINGWLGPWWPKFWNRFSFEGQAPYGDVDVQGNWKKPWLVRVFLFGDGQKLHYNGVALSHARLTLFTRPDFYDAPDVFITSGAGYGRGTFTHQTRDPGDVHLRTVFDGVVENLDPASIAPAISPAVVKAIELVKFEKPPALVNVSGRIDGPASPDGKHAALDIKAESSGPVSYDQIPFENMSLEMRIRDDVMDIARLETQFGGGHLRLKAQLSGEDEARRLGFDVSLNRASLGRTMHMIEAMAARRRDEIPAPMSKYQQQLEDGVLDIRLSADGLYSDPFSYTGNGSAEVTGELYNLNVFGALSEALRSVKILNFTSLSLRNGQMNFTVDHRKIIIPEAVMTGQKALVKLSGDYALDTQFANLTAKVYPLSQSRGLLGKGFGFLLVPVTHLTELRLTGSLNAPKWRFSYGPTSLFRALAGKTDEAPAEPAQQDAPQPEQIPAPNFPEMLRRK